MSPDTLEWFTGIVFLLAGMGWLVKLLDPRVTKYDRPAAESAASDGYLNRISAGALVVIGLIIIVGVVI